MEKKRFAEFDLAKAIAILGLPFVHFLEFAILAGYLNPAALSMANGLILLQALGPSVFMICMGFGMSGSYSCKRMIKSGVQFLIIAYVLNFCICTLPLLPTRIAGEVDFSYNYILSGIFCADIYVFAGWYCIFLGLMRKRKASNAAVAIVGVLLLALNSIISHRVYFEETVPVSILGNLLYVNEYSYFPFAGWSLFPTIGLLLGDWLKSLPTEKCRLQEKRMLALSAASLAALVVTLHMYDISALDLLAGFVKNYQMDVFSFLLLALIALFILSLLCVIYNAVKANPVERFLLRIAPLIMPFYLVHWVVTTVFNYGTGVSLLIAGRDYVGAVGIGAAIAIMLADWAVSVLLTLKIGLSFTRFILRITDYTRWFKRKKKLIKI